MNKWKQALGDFQSKTASAVNSAVRQIDKSLAQDGPILPQQQERQPDPHASSQYLRCVPSAACERDSTRSAAQLSRTVSVKSSQSLPLAAHTHAQPT